jgi:hypothetical protein
LSDEFSNLSAEGRYNLMHEGINSRALNAYVEIIFDNSDSRIMVRFYTNIQLTFYSIRSINLKLLFADKLVVKKIIIFSIVKL